MTNLKIQENIDEFSGVLETFSTKALKFVIKNSIDDTLEHLQEQSKKLAQQQLDRPAKSTLNSFAIKRARLNVPEGVLFVRPWAKKYMGRMIDGGTVRKGADKPLAVPVSTRLNKHGNIPGLKSGAIERILAKPDTYMGPGKAGKAVIWKRDKSSLKSEPVVVFETSRDVKKRLYWREMLDKRAAKTFETQLTLNIRKELQFIQRKAKAT